MNNFYTYISRISAIATLLLCCLLGNAQVGIGTSNPATGTILHVEDLDGTEKSGIIFPKVFLVDLNDTAPLLPTIESGTIVYNTNTNLQTGYYFWTVTKWQRLNAATGEMAKFTNTEAHTDNNLNAIGGTQVDLFGLPSTPPVFNDDPELYQRPTEPTATDPMNRRFLFVREAGRYQITVNLSMVADATNTSLSEVEVRLAVDDVETGPFYRSSEMHAGVSSLRGSISFTQTLVLDANAKISIVSRRATKSAGAVYLEGAGTSSFFIERILTF